MAQSQVNGSNLTDNGFGSYLQAKNQSGSVKTNGTVASKLLNGVRTSTPVVGVFGSTVIEDSVTARDYAGKAVTGGAFAHLHTRPIASLITSEIAGLNNNVIKTLGNDGDKIRSINKFETNKSNLFTTGVRANKYNRVTNKWDAGYPAAMTDSFSNDDAATPTSSVPGEFAFRNGSKIPFRARYAKKTSY